MKEAVRDAIAEMRAEDEAKWNEAAVKRAVAAPSFDTVQFIAKKEARKSALIACLAAMSYTALCFTIRAAARKAE